MALGVGLRLDSGACILRWARWVSGSWRALGWGSGSICALGPSSSLRCSGASWSRKWCKSWGRPPRDTQGTEWDHKHCVWKQTLPQSRFRRDLGSCWLPDCNPPRLSAGWVYTEGGSEPQEPVARKLSRVLRTTHQHTGASGASWPLSFSWKEKKRKEKRREEKRKEKKEKREEKRKEKKRTHIFSDFFFNFHAVFSQASFVLVYKCPKLLDFLPSLCHTCLWLSWPIAYMFANAMLTALHQLLLYCSMD